jgi:hypothetical protein
VLNKNCIYIGIAVYLFFVFTSLNKKPPGEELFDQELQAVLELSLLDASSQDTAESQEPDIKTVDKPLKIGEYCQYSKCGTNCHRNFVPANVSLLSRGT